MTEILPRLYLGSVYDASNHYRLKERGITHILTVAAGLEPIYPDEFTYHRVQVFDMPSASLLPHFPKIAEFINEGLEKGGVLVHCYAGISRSTSSVIAYMMVYKGWNYWDSLSYIRAKRPIANPNRGFQEQLLKFHKHLTTQAKELAKEEETKAPTEQVASTEGGLSLASLQASLPQYTPPSFKPFYGVHSGKSPVGEVENVSFSASEIKEIEEKKQEMAPQTTKAYLCKLCRIQLFEEKDVEMSPLRDEEIAPMHLYFIDQKTWIDDSHGNSGHILCPRKSCMVKIGTYSYAGVKLASGRAIKPSFSIFEKSIDSVVKFAKP